MTGRVYYTGDMANRSGWFDAAPGPGHIILTEVEGGHGRTIHAYAHQIGDTYQGHCSPRFVTEAAYRAYRAKQLAAHIVPA